MYENLEDLRIRFDIIFSPAWRRTLETQFVLRFTLVSDQSVYNHVHTLVLHE